QGLQGGAEVPGGLGEVGPVPEGPPDGLDRQVGAAELQCEHAEQVVGVRVLGVGLEDLPIEGPGPVEVASPVEPQGQLERHTGVTHGTTTGRVAIRGSRGTAAVSYPWRRPVRPWTRSRAARNDPAPQRRPRG